MRVTSYADPPEAIASYGPLSDDTGRQFTLRWAGEGIAELTELADGGPSEIGDRAAAGKLTNHKLYVARERLPAPDTEEYYVADLVGLAAVDLTGAFLGEVIAVHDYGAGASLEITTGNTASLLVPFTRASVPVVEIATRQLVVSPPRVIAPSPDEEAAA